MPGSPSADADFAQAMGEAFAGAVCPPIPFAEASPHECWEAVRAALGSDVTPARLRDVSEAEVAGLATAFAEWFEASPPSVRQIREGIEATLARWPVPSPPG